MRNHGADKILFRIRCSVAEIRGHIVGSVATNAIGLTEEERNKIFSKNAWKLLDFQGNMDAYMIEQYAAQ